MVDALEMARWRRHCPVEWEATLAAGEELQRSTTWGLLDQDGFDVRPGRYLIRGSVTVYQVGASAELSTRPYELIVLPR